MSTLTVTAAIIVALGSIVAGLIQLIKPANEIYWRVLRKRNRQSIHMSGGDSPGASWSLRRSALSNNLPAMREFIGRTDELERVVRALCSRAHILVIDGIGGVGKTSLALEAAHSLMADGDPESDNHSHRFAAAIWVPCNTNNFSLLSLFAAVARVLDYPGVGKLDLVEKHKAIAGLLQETKCLIVLDNYETGPSDEVLQFLGSLPGESKVLVTSRRQVASADWALSLGGLSQQDSIELIRSEGVRLNIRAIETAGSELLSKLYAATGGVPLAVRWAVGQIKQKGQTIDGILALLGSARSDIFATMFNRSWTLLSRRSRRVLATFSLVPNPLTRGAAAAGSGIRGDGLDECLGQLVELSLVESTDYLDIAHKRYRVHPLTRAFAASKLGRSDRFRMAAIKRLVDMYRGLAEVAMTADSATYEQLERERDNLLFVTTLGFSAKWRTARAIPLAIKWFLWEYGYWPEIINLCEVGMQQARANRDQLVVGQYAKEIAWVRCRQGSLSEASRWSSEARSAWDSIAVPSLDAADRTALEGLLHMYDGHTDSAKKLLTEALDVFLRDGEKRIETLRILTYLGELEQRLGHYDGARAYFSETLTRARALGQPAAVAWSLGNLGELEYMHGNNREARLLLIEGLDSALKISRYHTIANCAMQLTQICEETGEIDLAIEYCSLSLDKYSRLGIRDRVAETQVILSRLQPSNEGTGGSNGT